MRDTGPLTRASVVQIAVTARWHCALKRPKSTEPGSSQLEKLVASFSAALPGRTVGMYTCIATQRAPAAGATGAVGKLAIK